MISSLTILCDVDVFFIDVITRSVGFGWLGGIVIGIVRKDRDGILTNSH